ncbi:MAG: zinc-dependent metalloprotease [Arenimonas sp.]|uniref:reprolysin-like metallopeptidase n=1 Tax=Arenimonas sp. TaxID=1872635 RepID=UPI0025C3FF43|nr:M12 family metallo-peptidase [Arenimonas sp.]MBW8367309.1 zinc-dependent metalloprotease [Arenimonas sp.]
MLSIPLLRSALVLLACAGTAQAIAATAAAKPPRPVTLLKLEPNVQREGRLRLHSTTLQAESLQDAAQPGGLLVLPDPDGAQLSYDYVSHSAHASGDLTWVGRAEGAAFGQEAVVTIGPDAVFGRLPRPDGSVMLLETVGGRAVLMVDEGAAQGEPSDVQVDDALIPPMDQLRSTAKSFTAAALPPATTQANPNQLDVMLAYNSALATYVGSDAAVRTLLQNRIDVGNTALANGGVVGRFRLVATPRVDFPNTGTNSDALSEITYWRRTTAQAVAFQLATLRHRHGADIVGLVRRFDKAESVSCGNGWLGAYQGSDIAGSVDFGYFTASHGTSDGSFCSERTIGHEIGHNLGQNHDIASNDNERDGAHTYSHGFRTTPPGGSGFYTVMAYRDGSQVQALTFSNPNVTRADCANQACGAADADVARSLNITLPGAAAWFRPADEAVRDIATTNGHFEVTLSDLPALTDARWRIEYAGSGRMFATGPTIAAAGATLKAKVSWNALPGTPTTPLAARLVVESSPGVVVATRDLQLLRRDWVPAALALADGVPATVAVPAWNRTVEESRLYFPVPPHSRSVRVQVTSQVDVDLYANIISDDLGGSSQIGAGSARTAPRASDTSAALTKLIDIPTPRTAGASRVMVTLARPSAGSLSYANATVTATIQTQAAAPDFRSGQYFNPERSGHGVFVDFAGAQWVAVWYTYLEDGTPTWYYAQATAPAPGGSGGWSAPMFRIGWNGAATTATEIGQMIVTPTGPSSMVFSYNLDGDSGSETMVRLGGGSGCPTLEGAPLDATGHWFSPSRSGFGYSAQYEPDQEIYAAYLYDASGVARWLIGAKPWNEAVNQVALEQLRGSCPTCGFASTSSTLTGTLTRTLGTNADGRRGLAQISVSAPLLSPLAGTWTQSRATELLSARKDCR